MNTKAIKEQNLGAAFGAARLGMVACGDGSVASLVSPAISQTIDPDPSLQPAFDDAYARYGAVYKALKDLS